LQQSLSNAGVSPGEADIRRARLSNMNPSAPSESICNTTRFEGESVLGGARSVDPENSRWSGYTQPASIATVGDLPEEDVKTFTIDDALTQFGFGRTQVLMFFFTGLAWAGDGMEMMLLSYLGPEVRSELPQHVCACTTEQRHAVPDFAHPCALQYLACPLVHNDQQT
jgi:hypothetical protein